MQTWFVLNLQLCQLRLFLLLACAVCVVNWSFWVMIIPIGPAVVAPNILRSVHSPPFLLVLCLIPVSSWRKKLSFSYVSYSWTSCNQWPIHLCAFSCSPSIFLSTKYHFAVLLLLEGTSHVTGRDGMEPKSIEGRSFGQFLHEIFETFPSNHKNSWLLGKIFTTSSY